MNDIFIGYSRSDISKAELLADALEAQGWSVWWDKKIPPGARFQEVIEEQMRAAGCIIILWSRESVSSPWIAEEAGLALKRGTLVSVLVDDVKLPFEFRRIPAAANLSDWDGRHIHGEFTNLVRVVSKKFAGDRQRGASRSAILPAPKALGKTNVSPENIQKVERMTSMGTEDEVFVSYARIEKEFVLKLARVLKEKGIRVWVDLWDIPAGADWDKSIDDALHRCTQFLIVLSPASVESDEVRAELTTAFDEKKRVVPVLYRECQIPRRLRLIQYIDFSVADPGDEALLQDLILALRGPKHRETRAGVAIDLSHGQEEWHGFTAFTQEFIRNNPELFYKNIERSILQQKHEIEISSALVLVLPFRCEFTDDEIRYVKDWVLSGGGLFLLGYYFADTHHQSNPSNLARAFDFEFSNDLIMPVTRTSRRDCQDQAFELDAGLSVVAQVTSSDRHPIVQGVEKVAFLSACSLRNIIRKTECDIETPLSAVIEPEGRPTPKGYLLQIRDYVETRKDTVKVLAAWRYGRGKVVASGTWKLCTLNYGDNAILVKNIIHWLSQPSEAEQELGSEL